MSGSHEERLKALGIELPKLTVPVAAYVPTKLVEFLGQRVGVGNGGGLLTIAGQVPFRDGVVMATGPVPSRVPLEKAVEAARQCALNAISHARNALGTLDRIRQVVRVGVWVQCDAGFPDQPKVANGASELLIAVFGEAGRHARAAVGSIALPLNATVEVEVLFEVGPAPGGYQE